MRKFWRKMRRRKNIDFRNDPAPTDWLSIRVQKYAHLDSDFKTDGDYLDEFIAKLSAMRCQPICTNGHLADGQFANGQLVADQPTNGQLVTNQTTVNRPPVSCICSLVEQLGDKGDELVPVGEFIVVVEAAGFEREQALAEYKHYATKRIGDTYEPEFERLCRQAENAYNWGMEFDSDGFDNDEDDPAYHSHEIHKEMEALVKQIDQEVEAVMSAWSPAV